MWEKTVQEGVGFGNKFIERLPNSKQKDYLQGNYVVNSLLEHAKELEYD